MASAIVKKNFGFNKGEINYPAALEITTRISCQNMCSYCPQTKLINSYRGKSNEMSLSFETYKRAIDKVPNRVRIDFSGMAEPWLNKEATRMLLYANNKGHEIAVFTTLVGVTKEDIKQIKHIYFQNFVVHLPNTNGSERIIVDNKYLNVLKELTNSNVDNISFIAHGDVNKSVKTIVESGGYRIDNLRLISRGGNLENFTSNHKKGKLICIYKRLHSNVLLPNGDILLCCMDYGIKHKLGNLLKDDYRDLYKGEEYQKIITGLNSHDSNILCRECEWGLPIFSIEHITFRARRTKSRAKKWIKSVLAFFLKTVYFFSQSFVRAYFKDVDRYLST